MTSTDLGWLSLAAKDGHVLEIRMHEDEWAHETVARFERACLESPDKRLAAMLTEKP